MGHHCSGRLLLPPAAACHLAAIQVAPSPAARVSPHPTQTKSRAAGITQALGGFLQPTLTSAYVQWGFWAARRSREPAAPAHAGSVLKMAIPHR